MSRSRRTLHSGRLSVKCSDSTFDRFKQLKAESRERQGLPRGEFSHEEFLELLMRVWELHLEREHTDPVADVTDESREVVAHGG